MKIIFAWGWTWWHIFPSLAILNSLKKQDKKTEELFIISENVLDEEILSKTDFNYKKISSWKLRRYFSWENFSDLPKIIYWFCQSLVIISKFKPDVIFCKWWFVSLPVAIAWKVLWKKIILHESDSVMWIANKIISKFSDEILYWEKIWNPINFSGKIFSDEEKISFIKEKNFPENKKILFVSWGSQWAEEVNNLIKDNFDNIFENFFVIHLTWKWKSLNIKNKNYLGFEFLTWDGYFNFLQISDLIVSRAWAWSIAENLFFQKPSVLIPLIWSAWNHQVENAEKLELEKLCKKYSLWDNFLDILNSDFSEIKENLKIKNFKNPAEKISEEILKI